MHCTPRRWSRLRLARGLAFLAIAGGAAWTGSGTWFASVPAVALLMALDAFACWMLGRHGAGRFSASLSERRGDSAGMVLVGDEVVVQLALQASVPPFQRVFVTLVTPSGLDPADAGGAVPVRDSLSAGGPTVDFRLRASHAGTHAIPGVLLRSASPLGLFARVTRLEASLSITVLPDFVTTRNASLSRLFRRTFRAERLAPRRVRGLGSEFRELREALPGDPVTRVDWKATARRRVLIVREFEEPLEIGLHVILDASLDMTHDSNRRARFHSAATLVTRLACAAAAREMPFRLSAYDDRVVLDMAAGRAGPLRVAARVADLSRQSLFRRARAALASPDLHSRLVRRLTRLRRDWRRAAPSLAVERASLPPGPALDAWLEKNASFVSSIAPALLRDAPPPCPACRTPLFPDDAACPHCRAPVGSGELPPRAATLASLLAGARSLRGPGFLFIISTLEGGETCDAVTRLLLSLPDRGLSVHVVAPGARRGEADIPLFPGVLGQTPDRAGVLSSLSQLGQAIELRRFSRSLQEGGVHWHSLEDESDLEELVSEALMGVPGGSSSRRAGAEIPKTPFRT